MSALTVTLGADITSMKRSLGGAMGVISGFAKRISGVFSFKGGIVGALAGGSAAALATKLNATGEAGSTANARIQSVARSMGLFLLEFLEFMEGVKPKMAEASQFLVAVFRSGNATRLVVSVLKLGFAESVNFLVRSSAPRR